MMSRDGVQFLTREDEAGLGLRVRAWLDSGDESLRADGIAARNELVERNQPLILWVIETRLGASLPGEGDDDIQEGVLGLSKAAEKFDPSRGLRFTTYAVNWIQNFVQRGRRRRQLVRVPDYLYNGKRACSPRQQGYRDGAPVRANFDPETLDFVLAAVPAPDEVRRERAASELLGDCLDAAGLSVRERRIVLALHGVNGERKTLEALGVELGIHKERVRQIKEAAWKKVWLGARRDARLSVEIDEYVRAI